MFMQHESDRFYFDGQLHIPLPRMEETISTAISRGVDALFFTNYGNTANFDYLALNRDSEGRDILAPSLWDIERVSETVLSLSGKDGELYVLKSEEVKTKQGHLLIWGIKESIENGLDIEETLRRTYQQGGVGVFSHLMMGLFHGCGRDVFDGMSGKFKGYPLGVEQNGQIAWIWDKLFGSNRQVKELANEYGLACFGTSDIHGTYIKEHKKVGERYHSSVPKEKIDPKKMRESLADIMLSHPEVVQVEGNTNFLLETVSWNLDSIRINGRKKISDLVDGVFGKRKE